MRDFPAKQKEADLTKGGLFKCRTNFRIAKVVIFCYLIAMRGQLGIHFFVCFSLYEKLMTKKNIAVQGYKTGLPLYGHLHAGP